MSFQKFKTNSCCVGGRHHGFTTNIVADIRNKRKTDKEIKILTGLS